MKKFLKSIVFAATLAGSLAAQATVLLTEEYPATYGEGTRLGSDQTTGGYNTKWVNGNSTGTGSATNTSAGALTYASLSLISETASYGMRIQTSTSRNTIAPLTSQSGDGNSVYWSFLIKATAATPTARQIGGFRNSTGTGNLSLGFGINASRQLQLYKNSAVVATHGTTLDQATTYLVVVRYKFQAGLDEVAMWLNPTTGAADESGAGVTPLTSTTGSDQSTIVSLQILAAADVSGPLYMDEQRVTTTWAEATPQAGCTTAAITTGPASQTNYVGQTASFSVLATGSNRTNQWQANGGSGFTNIPGATGANYTTPQLTVTENGAQFQVIVGAACEAGITVTSSAATLTVIDGTAYSFRSVSSGDWTNLATWEQSDNGGGSWATPATIIPSSANGTITVQAGHIVTVNSPVTADDLTIAATGEVDASGAVLTINNGGAAIDCNVSGTLKVANPAGSALVTTGAGVQFNNGAVFQWSGNTTPTIPTATWADGSTCLIDNTLATANVNAVGVSGQSYYDFTINYPSVGFRTRLGITGTATTIRRNFAITIPDVASASVTLTTNTGTVLTIGGNFTVTTGGTVNTTKILTRSLNAESCNIKIAGNFSVTGYIDYFSTTAGGVSGFEFNGVGSQTVTLDPTHQIVGNTNNASYQIGTNATVVLGSNIPGGTTVTVNGTLNIGTNRVYGAAAGNFTINPGATVIGSGTNQLTAGFGTINYGGTVNLGTLPAFVGGETFVVFGGTAYTGAFTLSPSTPGIGLTWNTTALNTTGTLGVSAGGGNAAGYIASATVSGTDLILAISAGSPSTAFSVITSADLTVARSSWAVQGGGTFDGSGNASYTNALGAGPLFYSISVP